MQRKRVTLIVTVLVLGLMSAHGRVFASAPYTGTAYGVNGMPYPIQTPYVPERVIGSQLFANDNGKRVSVNGLNAPNGLFIDRDDHLFVADTKNNRVVEMDDQGDLIREFGPAGQQTSVLKEPEGVYVSPDGKVYVCDTGNGRIAVFNPDGGFVEELKKPNDNRLQGINFIPTRLSMDVRGFLYVNLKGVNQGLMVMTPDHQFDGFFGANQVQMSFLDKALHLFYSDEQKTASAAEAASVSDVVIDREGFIYTCTLNAATEQIKKYNVGGENLFGGKNMKVGTSLTALTGSYTGITVDSMGNIYAIDTGAGVVYQFDANGTPILSFGNKLLDNNLKIGLFGDPVSMKVNSQGDLFVTDRAFNGVQVFRPTELTMQIHQADALFNDGKYAEAAEAAKRILKLNAFYYKAPYMIGKALYKDKQWKASMVEFKKAYDTKDYSDAFWELRLIWVQQNFVYLIAALVALLILAGVAGRTIRKRKTAGRSPEV